jgi:hypothetical protein
MKQNMHIKEKGKKWMTRREEKEMKLRNRRES